MRLVVDTNVLIASLIALDRPPALLMRAWFKGRFALITSEVQLHEYRRATRSEGVRRYIRSAEAGRLANQLRRLGTVLPGLPALEVSSDPFDDFLLGMAVAGEAEYLVSGDKRHVLSLKRYERTRIVSAREMVRILKLKA